MSNIGEKSEKGYTLVIVLWTLVILGIIFSALLDEIYLDNNLLQYNLQEQKIRGVMIAGVMLAIKELSNDETPFDTVYDSWYQPIKGNRNNMEYTVRLEDYGSKINLNFASDDLLKGFKWFSNGLMEKRRMEIVPDLLFIKDILGKDFQKAFRFLTIYGDYNLNGDPVDGLEKLLQFLGITEQQINLITTSFKEYREEGNSFQSIEQFPLEVNGIDLVTFERLKPYLGITGRLNINLVEEELLARYFEFTGIGMKYLKELIGYRREQEIEELNQLYNILPEEAYSLLRYFTTSSKFFSITISVIPEDAEKPYVGRALVERELDGDEWQVKILKLNLSEEDGGEP